MTLYVDDIIHPPSDLIVAIGISSRTVSTEIQPCVCVCVCVGGGGHILHIYMTERKFGKLTYQGSLEMTMNCWEMPHKLS